MEVGSKLPSERELALQMGVSRPVVHEGILELQNMGLISLKSRFGAIVNDYRTQGSLPLLNSLLQYDQNSLKPILLENLLDLREHIEIEIARLAAINRKETDMNKLQNLLEQENNCNPKNIHKLIEIDFAFHLQLAVASGNHIYPLLLNSFRPVYTSYTGIFFKQSDVKAKVWEFHKNLLESISRKNPSQAKKIMKNLIQHGRKVLQTAMKLSVKEPIL